MFEDTASQVGSPDTDRPESPPALLDDNEDLEDVPAASTEGNQTSNDTTPSPKRSGRASVLFNARTKTPVVNNKSDPLLDKPKLGGLKIMTNREGKTIYEAFVGGKPKPDWSGLASPNPKPANANCYRSSGSDGSKLDGKMRKGLETKYSKGGKLNFFLLQVQTHLTMYGLDTVAYRTNLSKELSNVVEHHGSFVYDHVKTESRRIKSLWDTYTLADDDCARAFFLDSLSVDYQVSLAQHIKSYHTFADVFVLFIREELVAFSNNYKNLITKVENLKIESFPGDDVPAMCQALRTDLAVLQDASRLDPSLFLLM